MTTKSDRVHKLLEDPDLLEAFENVRQFYLTKIEELPLDEKTGEQALYDIRKQLFLLRQVKEDLETALQDGKFEDFRAAENERPGFLGEIKKWPRKA
jgi:hypothetical protein